MNDQFRSWLASELTQRRWSYTDLANRAGVSRPLVSRILAGDMHPSPDFCIKVAVAFDEPPTKLLRIAGILSDETNLELSPLVQQILQAVQNLPSKKRKEVLDYIKYLESKD